MDKMEWIIAAAVGAAAGAGAMYAKNASKTKDQGASNHEVSRLESEQQKREALEKENDRLRQEIADLKRKASRTGDETMDLEDDLEDEKRKVAKRDREIEQLKRTLDEYKGALQSCKLELEALKKKED